MASDGAYVLASDGPPGRGLLYPLRESPVYYVGKSSSALHRLLAHRRGAQAARLELEEWGTFQTRRYPRYTYAAALGAHVLWYSVRGTQTASRLEATLIDRF